MNIDETRHHQLPLRVNGLRGSLSRNVRLHSGNPAGANSNVGKPVYFLSWINDAAAANDKVVFGRANRTRERKHCGKAGSSSKKTSACHSFPRNHTPKIERSAVIR
jgi:hypothetical protein